MVQEIIIEGEYMSVIIDMDMPDKCSDCEFSWYDIDRGEYYCQIIKNYIDEKDVKSIPDYCSLKELVTCKDCKHWHRGMSADGQIEYINYSRCELGCSGNGHGWFCPSGQRKKSM